MCTVWPSVIPFTKASRVRNNSDRYSEEFTWILPVKTKQAAKNDQQWCWNGKDQATKTLSKIISSKLRLSEDTLNVGSQLFVSKKYYNTNKWQQELAPISHRPYKVLEIQSSTAVRRMSSNDERLLCNCNVEAPIMDCESKCTEQDNNIVESKTRYHEHDFPEYTVKIIHLKKHFQEPTTYRCNHG